MLVNRLVKMLNFLRKWPSRGSESHFFLRTLSVTVPYGLTPRPSYYHAFKGRAHARRQTVEYGVFVHPLVLSSGARHGPRIARPHGVNRWNLEMPSSFPSLLLAPTVTEEMVTQEELPAKPESGSEGSSALESTLTTRLRSDAALLVMTLTDGLRNVLTSVGKAGDHPVIKVGTRPLHRPDLELQAAAGDIPRYHAGK